MKLGILTFHRSLNHGAVLQAYALKQYLSRAGYDIEIIDYWPDYHRRMYSLFKWRNFVRRGFFGKLRYLISFVLSFWRNRVRMRRFEHFLITELGVIQKNPYRYPDQIPNEYDIVIYGSDQIWRKYTSDDFQGYDSVYFGAFPKGIGIIKIAYAASMGVINNSKEDRSFIQSYAKEFSRIFVREVDLLSFLKESQVPADLVLDPVFLLNSKSWSPVLDNSMTESEPYLLFYEVLESEVAKQVVSELSRKLDLKVITIRRGVHAREFNRSQTASPWQFLSLLKNSQFIVTTSFHGTAFSLIFQKQFFAVGLGEHSSRVGSLLDGLGLGSRYFDSLMDFDVRLSEKINYSEVNEKLSKQIERSQRLLLNEVLQYNSSLDFKRP